jgi:Putative redox-active protein (C_GCAxxG_C_C)
MVLGIHICKKFTENSKRKEETYAMVQKFTEKFKQIHRTTDCRSLLKCEIKTDEGHRFAKEHNLFETVCEKCISDSLMIIDELIEK